MDFIKVLNRHTIFEYTDLSDSEFTAWIKLMSLTAYLEKEPTREQMLKHVHHKTLSSLQDKIKNHSTTLQDILKKVLIDVQDVVKRREDWKRKKREKRAVKENVQGDVQGDVSDKIKRRDREDIDIIPPTPYPEWLPVKTFEEYQSARKKKLKPAQYERFFARLKRLSETSRASPEQILDQSIANGWEGVFELKTNGNGSQQGAMRI